MTKRPNSQRKHTIVLLAVSVGMFGFAFALVPLYEVFCELTGLNGRTSGEAAVVERTMAISDREVTVQFTGHVGRGLPWEFRPTESQMRVRLGEINLTRYYARNRADQAVTGQAVPSVAPGFVNTNLHKIECFCFTQQQLDGGEAVEMPVQFYVDAELPDDINTISLSYTFFHVDQNDVQLQDTEHNGSGSHDNDAKRHDGA